VPGTRKSIQQNGDQNASFYDDAAKPKILKIDGTGIFWEKNFAWGSAERTSPKSVLKERGWRISRKKKFWGGKKKEGKDPDALGPPQKDPSEGPRGRHQEDGKVGPEQKNVCNTLGGGLNPERTCSTWKRGSNRQKEKKGGGKEPCPGRQVWGQSRTGVGSELGKRCGGLGWFQEDGN